MPVYVGMCDVCDGCNACCVDTVNPNADLCRTKTGPKSKLEICEIVALVDFAYSNAANKFLANPKVVAHIMDYMEACREVMPTYNLL